MAESDTIPQMREQIDALQKQIKSMETSTKELSSENRLLKARDVFRQQGYDPVHGELFATSNSGEITAEAVDEFASKYGLVPTARDESPAEEEASVADNSDAMSSFSRAGSGAGSGGAAGPTENTLTRAEWVALSKSNPAAAKEAVSAGRVQLRADNPWT